MGRAREQRPERSPHHTAHSAAPDWPLGLGVDDRGASIHVCADCGEEIPDGALAERSPTGQVIAWTPGGNAADGTAIRNVVHECAATPHG